MKIRLQKKAEMLACLQAHRLHALPLEAFVFKPSTAAAEASVRRL